MEQKSTATEFIPTYGMNRINFKIKWNLSKNTIGSWKLHKTYYFLFFIYFFYDTLY